MSSILKINRETTKIAIIGLGYVGLPLAVEFSKKGFNVVGFDINRDRIDELKEGIDHSNEVTSEELKSVSLVYTDSSETINDANTFIVTVPTPITKNKKPNLSAIENASKMVGSVLKKNDIVIYESTVFPGCTEEICVPILEQKSSLIFNKDFFCGYSPERINPGDKKHRVHNIVKITSGSTPEIATKIDNLYKEIVEVGTFKASSIKIAEAAKVIENSQRDINIAFINELAIIFEKLGIDTLEVLEAAATKWNFLDFKPGLVGGHCIGVDPYYLTHKAQNAGYTPKVILSGRAINDSMGKYIAERYVKLLLKNKKEASNFKTLILGFTFKENCPDIRNTRVIDIYNELLDYNIQADIFDPNANSKEIEEEYNIKIQSETIENYDGIILAVAHNEFLNYDWKTISSNKLIFDVKGIIDKKFASDRL